jgi:Leucine-rich repeat (LRR) protein
MEIKKNEILSFELSSCHESISSLRGLNADLNARIEKLNVASPSLEHVSFCKRCKYFNIDACNNHVFSISKLNDEVPNLSAQLKICKNECEKIKFAKDAYTIGRHHTIKDGLGLME